MGKQKRKIDNRLIGTWRSHLERTLESMIENDPSLENKDLTKTGELFGKLTVKYTEEKIYVNLPGQPPNERSFKYSSLYEVIEKTENSVTIKYHDPLIDKEDTYTMHFDDNYYYIKLLGFREYFERLGIL